MSRPYKTIEDQNTYDVAVQQFGTLNNIDKVLRQMPDINAVAPFGYDMTFANTNNNLALRFNATNRRFATGVDSEIAPLFDSFDDTFDLSFK